MTIFTVPDGRALYEDLAVPMADSLAALGAFLDAAALDVAPPDFASLHAAAPDFFRGGDDARNIAEIDARCPALFNLFHGPMQARLGYPLAAMRGEPSATLATEVTTWFSESAAQRDRMAVERDLMAVERDRMAGERDVIAGERDRIAAERNGMRMSRFWRAREAVITMLRGVGLRSQN